MGDIKRSIRVMEEKKSAVQAARCRDPLESITNISKAVSRDGSAHEKVGEKRGCREEDVWVGCDSCSKWRKVAGGFEVDKDKSFFCCMLKDITCATPEDEWVDDELSVDGEAGLRDEGGGAGGGKLADKRLKGTKHKQQGVQGKGKGEAGEKRKRPLSEGAGTGKAQRGEGVAGAVEGEGAVKKGRAKCPHNREKSKCTNCGGASICEHNRRRSECKPCGGSSICEHNRIRSKCKPCGGASICEHNRIRSGCKQCGGSSICEHNREKSKCTDCGGASICEHNRIRRRCKKCETLLQNARQHAYAAQLLQQMLEEQKKAGEK
jgi:hypothetical protein